MDVFANLGFSIILEDLVVATYLWHLLVIGLRSTRTGNIPTQFYCRALWTIQGYSSRRTWGEVAKIMMPLSSENQRYAGQWMVGCLFQEPPP